MRKFFRQPFGLDMWRFRAFATALMIIGFVVPPSLSTANDPAPITVVALGDSLTAGYGLPKDDAFPVKLEAALRANGHAVTVINAGVSGDTSAGGRARLDWALGDKPDAVIVSLGANDALRGLTPQQMYGNLSAILTTLRDRGVQVLLAGMRSPPNLGPEYAEEFEGAYARLAEEFDVVFYSFFLEGVAAIPSLNQDDGIHPTAEGVDVMVRNIMPDVEDLLARVGKAGAGG